MGWTGAGAIATGAGASATGEGASATGAGAIATGTGRGHAVLLESIQIVRNRIESITTL